MVREPDVIGTLKPVYLQVCHGGLAELGCVRVYACEVVLHKAEGIVAELGFGAAAAASQYGSGREDARFK